MSMENHELESRTTSECPNRMVCQKCYCELRGEDGGDVWLDANGARLEAEPICVPATSRGHAQLAQTLDDLLQAARADLEAFQTQSRLDLPRAALNNLWPALVAREVIHLTGRGMRALEALETGRNDFHNWVLTRLHFLLAWDPAQEYSFPFQYGVRLARVEAARLVLRALTPNLEFSLQVRTQESEQ